LGGGMWRELNNSMTIAGAEFTGRRRHIVSAKKQLTESLKKSS